MEKRRDVTIDIAKGIGIILVVFSHLTFNGQMQRILVHSFNMPLFFIISGYLFKEIKRSFQKRDKKLHNTCLYFVISGYSKRMYNAKKYIYF